MDFESEDMASRSQPCADAQTRSHEAQRSDGWVIHEPGADAPAGHVRIRMDDGWESQNFFSAATWLGWESGVIVAYLPEGQSSEAPPIGSERSDDQSLPGMNPKPATGEQP